MTLITSIFKRLTFLFHDQKKQDIYKLADNTSIFTQTALASLYASKKKDKISKISDRLSNETQCIPSSESTQPPTEWAVFINDLKSQGIIDKVDSGVAPLDQQQLAEAWQLLVSGRAEKDIRKSIRSMLSTASKIDAARLHNQIIHIVDPRHGLGLLGNMLKDLNPTKSQKILNHTIKAIENEPLGEIISDTALIFTQKDNRTMRLAIVAYAQMNGININEKNIDDLNLALNKDNPDLHPLLKSAIDILEKEYGGDSTKQALEKIKNSENACS